MIVNLKTLYSNVCGLILKSLQFLVLCLALLGYKKSYTQSESLLPKTITESTTDEEILELYIDSIHKYIYRDIELTKRYIAESYEIVSTNIPIPDSLIFDLVVSEIYVAYQQSDPVEAYRLISEYKKEIPGADLTEARINGFNFLTSFTYMELGDHEAAQKSYYREIESGKETGDTSRIVNSLYSLGMLLDKESDYLGAVECYKEALLLIEKNSAKTRTKAMIHEDMGEAYISMEEYEKAKISLLKGQELSQVNNYPRLETDILFSLGQFILGRK